MKMTVEGMVNTLNGCRIAVAVLWTVLMFTVISNASYGDGDVEWGFLALCVIVEAVVTIGVRNMYYNYAMNTMFERNNYNANLTHSQGVGYAMADIRAAKLARIYFGFFATLWSFICAVICVGVWITV